MPLGGEEIAQACKVLKLKRPSLHGKVPSSAASSQDFADPTRQHGSAVRSRREQQEASGGMAEQPPTFREGEFQVRPPGAQRWPHGLQARGAFQPASHGGAVPGRRWLLGCTTPALLQGAKQRATGAWSGAPRAACAEAGRACRPRQGAPA